MNLRPLKQMFAMLRGGARCADTERLLYQFVEDELEPRRRAQLEAHLRDCPECQEFVRTYRATLTLTHAHGQPPPAELPPELSAKLRSFIAENPELR